MDDNEATPKPEAVLKLGALVLDIVDPTNVQPVAADVIIETREVNGMLALGFGAVVIEGNSDHPIRRVMVTSRLRMTLATAADLRNFLDGLLRNVVPPKHEQN